MVSVEEILITMMGKDEVTPVVNSIQGNVSSAFSGMTSQAQSSASSIAQSYQSTFDQIGRGLSSLNQGMMGISSVSNMMMSELGATKSAMDYVYGTTAKANTNKVLVRSWGDAKTTWEDIYDTIDHVTDKSLTSMQDLIPAMNAFKASTNATGEQLKDDVAENMAQFGAYVLALTGSEQLARTAMTDLSKGLVGKGAFSALDQYGVTKDTLMARGWSGENEDIEGYMKAIKEISGQAEELMETSQGLDAQMGKMWSRAGKRIGNSILPGLDSLKEKFIELDDELDGELATAILRVALGIEEAQKKLYMFNTMWEGVKNISEAFNTLKGMLGLTKVEQEANNLMQEENNRLVQESNVALMENNELRLANADAMGLQNLGMQGQNFGGDYGYGMPMGTESEEGSWGSDVLSNTAGGMLESKYQRLRGRESSNVGTASKTGRKEAQAVQDLIERTEHNRKLYDDYEEVLWDFSNANESINKTSKKLMSMPETGMYGASFFNRLNTTSAMTEKIVDNVDKQNVRLTKKIQKVGETAVKSDSMNKKSPLTMNWGSMVNGDLDVDSLKNIGGSFNREAFEDFVKQNDGEKQRVRSLLDSITDDDTLEEGFEAIQKEGMGPFNRFSIWLNEKKKRKLPSFDTDFGLSSIASSVRTRLGEGVGNLRNAFSNIGTRFSQFRSLSFADKMDNIWTGLKNSFGKLRGGQAVVEEGVEAMGETAVGMGTMATETAVVGAEAGVIGAESTVASGEMAVAETGITFMGLAEMGLAGAFTTLIVPTLAVAGVIAILIPIIAGLVIEALFFIQIIGQFMASLNFDFNLDGIAEKFQALGVALAWLGVVMAGMSFAGLMTGLAYIFTGFGNVKIVLGKAVDMIKDTVGILNQFQYSTQIDPSVADNLGNVSNAIMGVTSALAGLVGTQIMSNIGSLVTGFGHFGSLTDTFRNAQRDIQEAIDSINQMDFSGIDESKVGTIKTTLEAISAFADAFKGLNDIRLTDDIGGALDWLLNGGLFGGQGQSIEQAFKSAHDDIVKASKALKEYGDIDAPPQEVADKLKSAGDSIKGVADAISSLRELRDAYNWDDWVGGIFNWLGQGGGGIQEIFGQALTDLNAVSQSLSELGKNENLSKIPDDLPDKLKKVSDSVSGVASAISSIQAIPVVQSTDIGPKIRQSVNSVQLAINGLSLLNGQTVSESIGTLLTNVTTGVQGVASVVNSALAVPMTDRTVIGERIRNAIDGVQLIINGLNRLNGQSVVDISGMMNQIKTSLDGVKNTLNAVSFSPQGVKMGQSLKSGVYSGMMGLNATIGGQLQNAVNHSGAWTKGKTMGTQLTNGFKAGLNLTGAVQSHIASMDIGGMISSWVSSASSSGDDASAGGASDMEGAINTVTRLSASASRTASRLTTLNNMNTNSNLGTGETKNVSINIGEGAVQLDARNMTAKESRQIMINALEGLSVVRNVDV